MGNVRTQDMESEIAYFAARLFYMCMISVRKWGEHEYAYITE